MSAPDHFEFNDIQNSLLTDLAKKMRFVGALLVLGGVVSALAGLAGMVEDVVAGLTTLISAAVYLAIGVFTRQAAKSFNSIVATEGDDVSHLMDALGKLLKLYRLQYWLIMVILAVMVLALVGGIFAAVTSG